MKQIFLNSGTYTYKPFKGKLDMEKYILSVLEKDTCCAKTIFADTITTTTFTVSGVFSIGNGTVAAPSLTFASDTDSGLYRIGANNIGVGVNGAKVLDVSTTGLGVVGKILNGDGTVALPAFSFTSDTDCGWYRIGANNIGCSVNGAKVLDVATTGLTITGVLKATSISEATTDLGVILNHNLVVKHTTFAVNISATVLAANFTKGYFTSTSAAAVNLQLDTATNIATAIGAVQGTIVDFVVDNSAGANTVTVVVGAGITTNTSPITGGSTLTVSTANTVGYFRLIFTSATAAKIVRIA